MATRVLMNKADLEGQLIGGFGGLRVGSMVSRNPLVWTVRCETCRATTTKAHESLMDGTARCLAGGCGRAPVETLADYQRGERDRANRIVERREAARKAEADAAAARLAKAEENLNSVHRKLAKTLQERILTQRDDEFYLSPEDIGISCSAAEARERNAREASIFLDQHPEYFQCESNFNAVGNYLERNGAKLANHKTLAAAVSRLREANLIREAPRPVPVPVVSSQPIPVESKESKELDEIETMNAQLAEMNERDKAYRTEQRREYDGYDLQSGRPRSYTEQELAYLSADEFRRAFKLPTAPPQRLAW